MKTLLYFPLLFFALFILASCEREWNNPWDSNADIMIHLSEVSIATLSIDSAEISWAVQPQPEGIKIDKKINNEPWMNEFATVTGNHYFIDKNLNTRENSYQYRVYAFAGKNTSNPQIINYNFACGFDSVVDPRDGNIYPTTQIGKQCWFASNLKYLPEVFPPATASESDKRYYVYDYDGTSIIEAKNTSRYNSYGVLYNAAAAISACPESEGWYLPEPSGWQQLVNYSGGFDVAGSALKEQGFEHWNEPNTAAVNTYGFSARPGGKLEKNGYFSDIGISANYWAGPEKTNSMYYNSTSVSESFDLLFQANSIRCIKDQ